MSDTGIIFCAIAALGVAYGLIVFVALVSYSAGYKDGHQDGTIARMESLEFQKEN